MAMYYYYHFAIFFLISIFSWVLQDLKVFFSCFSFLFFPQIFVSKGLSYICLVPENFDEMKIKTK